MQSSRSAHQRVLLLCAAFIFLGSLLLFTYRSRPSSHHAFPTLRPTSNGTHSSSTLSHCNDKAPLDENLCSSFPQDLLSDVQFVLKTGIGEHGRLEAPLSTYLSCVSNLLIVSDAEVTAHGHEVHDILADLPPSYAQNNSDWAIYNAQLQELSAGDEAPGASREGWRLDRFKFLPMVEYAYDRNPDAKWYVFFEGDTYLFLDTLFGVLARLHSEERHYFGTAVIGAYDRWFAYGGSGFVLSQGTMRDLPLAGEKRLSAEYEDLVREDCCGDAVLAYVLFSELGLRMGQMFPSFSGDAPQWISVWAGNWCKPLVTLHHIAGDTMSELWRWEQCRRSIEPGMPMLFSSLLDWRLSGLLGNGTGVKAHWNNGADKEQSMDGPFTQTAEACFAACARDQSCVQATFEEGVCRFGSRVRLGDAVERDVQSSWDLGKLQRMGWSRKEGTGVASCPEINWPEPEIMAPSSNFIEWLVGNCLGFRPTSRGCLTPNRHPP